MQNPKNKKLLTNRPPGKGKQSQKVLRETEDKNQQALHDKAH